MVLNYSSTRLGHCNLFEAQKHTSSSHCGMKTSDEAGVEERELRHQRWHCEYLTVFMGTSYRSQPKNTSLAEEKVAMFD